MSDSDTQPRDTEDVLIEDSRGLVALSALQAEEEQAASDQDQRLLDVSAELLEAIEAIYAQRYSAEGPTRGEWNALHRLLTFIRDDT